MLPVFGKIAKPPVKLACHRNVGKAVAFQRDETVVGGYRGTVEQRREGIRHAFLASPWHRFSSCDGSLQYGLIICLAGREARPFVCGGYIERSEARRVGKEGVRKCRSRWSPCH